MAGLLFGAVLAVTSTSVYADNSCDYEQGYCDALYGTLYFLWCTGGSPNACEIECWNGPNFLYDGYCYEN
jgi:hypothetical protein